MEKYWSLEDYCKEVKIPGLYKTILDLSNADVFTKHQVQSGKHTCHEWNALIKSRVSLKNILEKNFKVLVNESDLMESKIMHIKDSFSYLPENREMVMKYVPLESQNIMLAVYAGEGWRVNYEA
jgi:hypothetical protein